MTDLKKTAEELIGKITSDPSLLTGFQKDPAGTIKTLLHIDLPEDQLNQVAQLVKTKLAAQNIAGAADKLKGLFGKK